jgi:hypothetical protein
MEKRRIKRNHIKTETYEIRTEKRTGKTLRCKCTNNKHQIPEPGPEPEPKPEPEQIVYIPKQIKQKPKKNIIKKLRRKRKKEEEVVYMKKNRPKRQESLDRTLFKSSAEPFNLRAVEERIRHNLAGWHSALMPREF